MYETRQLLHNVVLDPRQTVGDDDELADHSVAEIALLRDSTRLDEPANDIGYFVAVSAV